VPCFTKVSNKVSFYFPRSFMVEYAVGKFHKCCRYD